MPSSKRPKKKPGSSAPPPHGGVPHHLQDYIVHQPVAYYRVDREGNILMAEPALAGLLGFDGPGELLHRRLFDFYVDPRQKSGLLEKAESQPGLFGELAIRRHDGQTLWVREYPRLLHGADGKPDGHEAVWFDITSLKKTEEELQHRIQTQDLVARISTRFINLAPVEMEQGVEHVLQEVAEFADADWSFIFLWSEDGGRSDYAREWHIPGIPNSLENLQSLDIKHYPWAKDGLQGMEALRITNIDELPPQADHEKKILLSQGVRSAIIVPILLGNSLRGAMCLSTYLREKAWPEDTILLLRLLGQILFNALERKRYDTALQESEKKYRTLVDKSLLGINITQNHVLKFCNQKFADMFGYESPEVMAGLSVRLLVAPQSWEIVEREVRFRESGQKEISRYEFTAARRDGTSFEAEVLGSRIMYEGLPAVQGMMIDITERKRAQHLQDCLYRISETSRSSPSLDELFLSLHRIITELMPTRNFYIALYNPADGLVHFPYFVDEFDSAPLPQKPGKRLTDYVLRTGEPLLAAPDVFNELERKGEVESVGTPSIDWLGVPLKMEGETRGVLVVQSYTPGVRYGETEKNILKFVSDHVALAISRKQAESVLMERERFLSSIFDSIQDGLSVLTNDYAILRVNKKMEKWYAHAMPLVGKKCFQAYHLRTEGCDICPVRKTYATGKAAMEVVPMIGAGGQVTGWLDLYSFPLLDQSTGQMKGVIEYVRDITDQHRAEDALKSSLQEKEVLLREVHHRVKNNMQVISSLLSLQSGQMKDPKTAEMFRDSQRRIRSMALVHERLYQSVDLSRIEFSEYLRSLAVHLFNSIRVDASAVRVKVEAEEIFLNINTAVPCGLISNELLSNALKHAFPDGRRGEVRAGIRRLEGEKFELLVEDDGIGLPADLDWRNSPSLGMQVVNMLAAQLEGTVELSRERGTSFKVVFKELSFRPLP